MTQGTTYHNLGLAYKVSNITSTMAMLALGLPSIRKSMHPYILHLTCVWLGNCLDFPSVNTYWCIDSRRQLKNNPRWPCSFTFCNIWWKSPLLLTRKIKTGILPGKWFRWHFCQRGFQGCRTMCAQCQLKSSSGMISEYRGGYTLLSHCKCWTNGTADHSYLSDTDSGRLLVDCKVPSVAKGPVDSGPNQYHR